MSDTTVVPISIAPQHDERAMAESLAKRYRAEFVDLKNFKIQHDLLRTVPVEPYRHHTGESIESDVREPLVIIEFSSS